METIILTVPNKQSRSFLLKILQYFDFVTVVEQDTDEKQDVLESVKEGFREAQLMHKGDIPARSFDDFIDEL
jgi:hypothetical protein